MKILHNPRCRKSREGLKMLEESGNEFEIVDYLNQPLDVRMRSDPPDVPGILSPIHPAVDELLNLKKMFKENIFDRTREILFGYADENGKGGICPNLADSEWKYGSADDDIYKSIAEGRPGGMPNWNESLSEEKIKDIVAYIRSLSAK